MPIGMVAKEFGGEILIRKPTSTYQELITEFSKLFPQVTKAILGHSYTLTDLEREYNNCTKKGYYGEKFTKDILFQRFDRRNRYHEFSDYYAFVIAFFDKPTFFDKPKSGKKSSSFLEHSVVNLLKEHCLVSTATELASTLGVTPRTIYRKANEFITIRKGTRMLFVHPKVKSEIG
jgi:hypothetical protein